jgi:hypothetical protein
MASQIIRQLLCIYKLCGYPPVVGGGGDWRGGGDVELVSFRAHRGSSHKIGDIICHRITLFLRPLIVNQYPYFLWDR